MTTAAQKLISVRDDIQRRRVNIRGAVQGVGFRPFVYKLASELCLGGSVRNSSNGVFIEIEGRRGKLDAFLRRLNDEKPPLSYFQSTEIVVLDAAGESGFRIVESDDSGAKIAVILPDAAVCPDCLRDIDDPLDRRFRYPFTNCTNCGPRYSIIEAVPYDRRHTSMKKFRMCEACWSEYSDPANRRFHAQPNACPECGPRLGYWDKHGRDLSQLDEPLLAAAQSIRDGEIVAVKGLGGFHLMVDARDPDAVDELRRRKHREEKPLAVMFPNIECLELACRLSEEERSILTSPASPIVLLEKRVANSLLCESVAPGNPYVGAMLPYTPLHHLLLSDLGFPVVATSGNLSDEPICIDEHEAVKRLKGIADHFLVHDRPIVRHVDDSIVRIMMGRPLVLRRARGFAPLPVKLATEVPAGLAVGGHLKNTVALSNGDQLFVSQHIGDLDTEAACAAFERVTSELEDLLEIKPAAVAHDLHPDYRSTRWARNTALKRVPVQHHYAHILSCMAENEVRPPALGIAWDGTGYGTDGTMWGGEFLRISETSFDRIAHFHTFPLPGGDAAAREPRRSAIGLLYSVFGANAFEFNELEAIQSFKPRELAIIREMLSRGVNSPLTSSAGRIFDAVASLIGLRQTTGYEGQAAMELEFIADRAATGHYPFSIDRTNGTAIIDIVEMVRSILHDRERRIPNSIIASRFHNTMAEIMVEIARLAGEKKVALSGGCFQNKLLTELAVTRLGSEGFKVYWHQRIPPNDGGIALGQIAALAAAEGRRN